jgi:hypothetical protein
VPGQDDLAPGHPLGELADGGGQLAGEVVRAELGEGRRLGGETIRIGGPFQVGLGVAGPQPVSCQATFPKAQAPCPAPWTSTKIFSLRFLRSAGWLLFIELPSS